jgi:hypothetical protein
MGGHLFSLFFANHVFFVVVEGNERRDWLNYSLTFTLNILFVCKRDKKREAKEGERAKKKDDEPCFSLCCIRKSERKKTLRLDGTYTWEEMIRRMVKCGMQQREQDNVA